MAMDCRESQNWLPLIAGIIAERLRSGCRPIISAADLAVLGLLEDVESRVEGAEEKANLGEVEVGVDGRRTGCGGGAASVEATIFTMLPPSLQPPPQPVPPPDLPEPPRHPHDRN